MATNGEQAAMLQEHKDMIEALQGRNSVLARQVAELKTELATLKGDNATPQRGCRIAAAYFGEATVLCEYEFTPAEAPIYDADHPGVGPGHDDEVSLIQVFINGQWIDPGEIMSASQIERTEQYIIDQEGEA
jgi:hypothetical protein